MEGKINDQYPVEMQEKDKAYTVKKLGLTDEEFEGIMALPKKTCWDYPSYPRPYKRSFYKRMKSIYRKAPQ